MSNTVLLVAPYSIIEPLGLFYLSSVAKQEKWEPKIFLTDYDYSELKTKITDINASVVGFTVYTGIHKEIFDLLSKVKQDFPKLTTIIGGPHATCFPDECCSHANYVVVGEGLYSFRKILKGKATKKVLYCDVREQFPITDRVDFYKNDLKHGNSLIKSVIANFGCPFECSYCYNSMDKNLFPLLFRSVDNVIKEIENLLLVAPNTKTIFFQDDVFGLNLKWLQEFTKRYKKFGIPFHCQTRFEFINPKKNAGYKRLDLLKEAGCSGITLAIESYNDTIRKEVLNRNMANDLIFDSMHLLSKMDFKVRTEQIIGLPCGATSQETEINLESDLKTLEFNVDLVRETGLPTISWASILMPYKGTKIWKYCRDHGFYTGDNDDIPKTFFNRSVLRFPKQYVGSDLNENSEWLKDNDLDTYKNKMLELRNMFHLMALLPDGHKLARSILESKESNKLSTLLTKTKYHLYDNSLYGIT